MRPIVKPFSRHNASVAVWQSGALLAAAAQRWRPADDRGQRNARDLCGGILGGIGGIFGGVAGPASGLVQAPTRVAETRGHAGQGFIHPPAERAEHARLRRRRSLRLLERQSASA